MRKPAPPNDIVLIIDPDESIRKMMSAVLRRAGFATRSVGTLNGAALLLSRTKVDAIVRDVNLAPAVRAEAMQQLAATAREILWRTVIATTSGPVDLTAIECFAVIRKPFDIDQLVRVVRACVERNRTEEHVTMDVQALQRFVSNAADLRRVFAAPTASPRELLLRSEMRRTILELSAALSEAARAEPSRTRAAAFQTASAVAAELVTRPMDAERRHGH
ncbi:MAG TPA: response regulator [Thermoanaerobaculia bacterium]|jgi:DNA-binding response OmpR family regulator|nr:response regulator [Thermoanaerobaculia bacterium]